MPRSVFRLEAFVTSHARASRSSAGTSTPGYAWRNSRFSFSGTGISLPFLSNSKIESLSGCTESLAF